MSPSTLAEMLTIIEFEDQLRSLRAREFIDQRWTKREHKTCHPDLGGAAHLCRALYCNQQRVVWVVHEILNYGTWVGPMSEAIEFFLRVARSLLERHNFATFFQVVRALGEWRLCPCEGSIA